SLRRLAVVAAVLPYLLPHLDVVVARRVQRSGNPCHPCQRSPGCRPFRLRCVTDGPILGGRPSDQQRGLTSTATSEGPVMAAKITRDALEGYLNCKYKGHLKLAGEHGTQSDYEALLADQRDAVRLAALDKILARHPEDQVARQAPLSPGTLKRGPLYLLDATLEDESF